MVQQILDIEKQKLELRLSERGLNEKQIDNHAKLAERQLELQAQYLKGKPKQDRYTLLTAGGIAITFFIIALSFLIILLYMGKEEFAKYMLITLSHIIVGVASYAAGRKKKDDGTAIESDIDDAEIIE